LGVEEACQPGLSRRLPPTRSGLDNSSARHAVLSDLKDHERLVEDIIPAKVHVTCYHICADSAASLKQMQVSGRHGRAASIRDDSGAASLKPYFVRSNRGMR
jgi:hypothetical protein